MRRDEPSRHGRAADAVIASYLRELVAEDEPEDPRPADEPSAHPLPPAIVLPSSDGIASDAML